ncbi:hypothetical protein ACLOJK_001989 [Asimina triloba]
MEERQLDLVLVPMGLLVMGIYHGWLLFTILRYPKCTVIGLNAMARQRWVKSIMADPLKNGILAVQTLRNNIMASTLLASTAITLSSLIGVVVSGTSLATKSPSNIVYGNKSQLLFSIKYFTILICFLLAFLFNVQCIRYYAHVSFLLSVSPPRDAGLSITYVGRCLNRGSVFWSLGLRAFYVSFPLFLWIFGPIPMFVCCCVMSCALYFLDSTTDFSRHLHDLFGSDEELKTEGLDSPTP